MHGSHPAEKVGDETQICLIGTHFLDYTTTFTRTTTQLMFWSRLQCECDWALLFHVFLELILLWVSGSRGFRFEQFISVAWHLRVGIRSMELLFLPVACFRTEVVFQVDYCNSRIICIGTEHFPLSDF